MTALESPDLGAVSLEDATTQDCRLAPPDWSVRDRLEIRWRLRLLIAVDLVVSVWYFGWLLQPSRVGNPLLYGLLIGAELFNFLQALGFWWTAVSERHRATPAASVTAAVDVLIPVYNEPVEIVEPTVLAASKLQGAVVHLLDDGKSAEMQALAARTGVHYVRRPTSGGAKAGNLNYAIGTTTAPYIAVVDCDHVVRPNFLEATLPHLADPQVAFVQTPQYYANAHTNPVARSSWAQQALFFGRIARGKDGLGSMFCCGTNVVFRREALEQVGGFPESSLTEDFELSLRLHERSWRSVYVPEVLASGLGPEDMGSYVSQQLRWARGCLSSIPVILRSRLPFTKRLQYLLSASFFLSGWTFLVYMIFPVVRIFAGAQPLSTATASQFLVHFAPYFGLSLLTVAAAGGGAYTFGAYSLLIANFWIHIVSSIMVALRRRGSFVVTSKQGTRARQPRAVLPALMMIVVLVSAMAWGLAHSRSPATVNNVAFAGLHTMVLLAGAWPALEGARLASGAETVTSEELESAA
ncbi:MAG: glycosyltransferase [Actinomycetota bacterium]|nr:glycosyltransferase [Actinomycetota bacterium]